MTHLRNTPVTQTIIQLEARKSFSCALWVKDFLGHMLDITGVTLRLVARKKTSPSDISDLTATLNVEATLVQPTQGYARFDIQADQLNLTPGEYEMAVTMVASGYSSVIIEGLIIIDQNPDFTSMNDTFTPGIINPPQTLIAVLQEQNAITVYAGQALAPGTVSFTTEDEANLDALVAEGWNVLANRPSFGSAAFVNVEDVALPPGGSPGSALLKSSAADYQTHWAQIATGGTGLDATGQPTGAVPRATGLNTWDWAVLTAAVASVAGRTGDVVLNAADIAETAARFWLSAANKTKLDNFSYTDLANKPVLGTASTRDDAYFLRAVDMISNTILPKLTGMRGYSRGTAAPAGGVDGDWYGQYTA